MSKQLPVLFLNDLVVLPGMVVPIELDDSSRAAIDTARASSDGELLVAPAPRRPVRLLRRGGVDRADRPAADR